MDVAPSSVFDHLPRPPCAELLGCAPGRIEPLHFLRAFESGADLVYLITCPERACRYQQGNERAWKRIRFAQKLVEEIGLDPERLILEQARPPLPQRIDLLLRELLDRAPDKGQSLLRRL